MNYPCPTSQCLTRTYPSPDEGGPVMHFCWTHWRVYGEGTPEEGEPTSEKSARGFIEGEPAASLATVAVRAT